MTSMLTVNLEKEYRDEVLRELHNGVVVISFEKKDGSLRDMRCTLKSDLVIPYEKKTERTKEHADNIIPVFDVEKQAWRSFDFTRLLHYKRT